LESTLELNENGMKWIGDGRDLSEQKTLYNDENERNVGIRLVDRYFCYNYIDCRSNRLKSNMKAGVFEVLFNISYVYRESVWKMP
jgi:hypothetical protein